jgi:hypothetical protein
MWKDDVLQGLFPITSSGYWFVTAFIATMLLSPAVAKLTLYLSTREFAGVTAALFTVLSIVSYYDGFAYSHVFWFFFLTLAGSGLKRFEPVLSLIRVQKLFVNLMIMLTINMIGIYYFSTNKVEWVENHGGANFMTIHNQAPLALFISINLFLLVSRLEYSSSIVNLFGGLTFGVYLLHDNRFLRPLIWKHWVRGPDYQDSPFFYVFTIMAPMVVFIACALVEWLRQRLLGGLEQWITVKITDGLVYISDLTVGRLLDQVDKAMRTRPTNV